MCLWTCDTVCARHNTSYSWSRRHSRLLLCSRCDDGCWEMESSPLIHVHFAFQLSVRISLMKFPHQRQFSHCVVKCLTCYRTFFSERSYKKISIQPRFSPNQKVDILRSFEKYEIFSALLRKPPWDLLSCLKSEPWICLWWCFRAILVVSIQGKSDYRNWISTLDLTTIFERQTNHKCWRFQFKFRVFPLSTSQNESLYKTFKTVVPKTI